MGTVQRMSSLADSGEVGLPRQRRRDSGALHWDAAGGVVPVIFDSGAVAMKAQDAIWQMVARVLLCSPQVTLAYLGVRLAIGGTFGSKAKHRLRLFFRKQF